MVSTRTINRRANNDELMGHPRGLFVCFMTELWERFSYYGMRALLIFYLTQHFLFSDGKSYQIYGAYTALVYVMPVIGGLLADKYLGARKAVVFGAILLVLGHFGMAFEGKQAQQYLHYDNVAYQVTTTGQSNDRRRSINVNGKLHDIHYNSDKDLLAIENSEMAGLPSEIPAKEYYFHVVRDNFFLNIFYLSLALIISGVGFLKANISTIVGTLYAKDDPRRDSGFTIFYMGINIGSFVSVLLCGWLGQTYGWAYGFGVAGFGMLAGLIVFLKGQHLLGDQIHPPCEKSLRKPLFANLSREFFIYAASILGVLVIWQLIQHQQLVGQLLKGFAAMMLLAIMIFSFWRCEKVERERMLVACGLILFSVFFWALFEQAGSSLNLFTDRSVNRNILGAEVPASMFQSLNALFIFILAPLFSIMWTKLAAKGREPSTPAKFSLGLLNVGLGFLVLVFGGNMAENGQTALIWIILIYLLHTIGELCLSPVGLSMITKLSVPRVVGMMMGTWFLASAGANYIAGEIAQLTGSNTDSGAVLDQATVTANTLAVYSNVGWLAVGVATLLLALTPLLRKGMHGIH